MAGNILFLGTEIVTGSLDPVFRRRHWDGSVRRS
jgi:hypothetical protein